jgi:predicted nuclease of predicted toxin-antitoxin system
VIRVLLDQGLAPRAAALLRDEGWDALHVSEVELSEADDLEILDVARRHQRTCVTLDHDFHAHLALAGLAGPSVVFLRIENLVAEQQATLIRRVFDSCGEDLEAGAAVTADRRTTRVRRLPLR